MRSWNFKSCWKTDAFERIYSSNVYKFTKLTKLTNFFGFLLIEAIVFGEKFLFASLSFSKSKGIVSLGTVKLGIKELLNKEQTGFKKLFNDYQPFYTINLLLKKELLPI